MPGKPSAAARTRRDKILAELKADRGERTLAILSSIVGDWMLGDLSQGAMHVALAIAYLRLSPPRLPQTRISDRDLAELAHVKAWHPGFDVPTYVEELEARYPQWFAAVRQRKHRSMYTFTWPGRERAQGVPGNSAPHEGGQTESAPHEGGQTGRGGAVDNQESAPHQGGQSAPHHGGHTPNREGLPPLPPRLAGGTGGEGTPRPPAADSPPTRPAADRNRGASGTAGDRPPAGEDAGAPAASPGARVPGPDQGGSPEASGQRQGPDAGSDPDPSSADLSAIDRIIATAPDPETAARLKALLRRR